MSERFTASEFKVSDDDTSDMYRAMKERSKEKREANRDNAPKILEEAGISFSSHNLGAHLVVRAYGWVVDCWPGTGRWTFRDTTRFHGFGIFSMIQRLKENKRADE